MSLRLHRIASCRLTATVAALIFVLSLPPEATAQVTNLSCIGTLRVIRQGVSLPEEPWTFSVIMDTDKKTVTLEDYEPVPLFEDISRNTVVLMPSIPIEWGVSTGTLNRVTGQASINILKDGLYMIRGICNPGRKLI